MTVELRPVAGDVGLYEVEGSGIDLGYVRLAVSGAVAQIAGQLDRAPAGDQDLGGFIMTTVARAREAGATEGVIHSDSLLLRDAARRAGFGGPARAPLRAVLDAVAWPVAGTGSVVVPDRRGRIAWLVGALATMGVPATAAPPARGVGRLAQRLAGGVGDTLDVVIERWPGKSFLVRAPDRFDTMPEPVALAADTGAAVLNRFPQQADAVKIVSFDQAHYGMHAGGLYAGVAEGSVPSIHLTVAFVTVEAFTEALQARGDQPRRSASARPPQPWTVLDGVVAHELWHRIEMMFEAHHYRESIELRRQIGLELGVETLEQAIKGASPKAPDAWQHAYRRLADEVSDYATTERREATAEMFKLWWCRGEVVSPVVARFGALVDHFFPL